MRDKRPVDELTIEELERILAIRKREERQQRMDRMKRHGRMVESTPNGVKQHPPQEALLATSQPPLTAPAPSTSLVAEAARPAKNPPGLPQFEDGVIVDEQPATAPGKNIGKIVFNQLLLLVEIAAVLGIIYLAYTMFQSIGKLEEETASAQQQINEQRLAALPTIAPTPQLRLEQFVLPGGHTPPTAPGGAQFNLNEVPENLLPLIQSQVFPEILRRPQPTTETALRVIIPKLNINQSIVQGTDWEALKQGVGQLQNGVNPGDPIGNVVLNAHNDIYGELFRHLDQLEAGDRFQVQTQNEVYTYQITGWELFKPTDVHVLNSRGTATATLISCYPYQVNTERLVVFADRIDT